MNKAKKVLSFLLALVMLSSVFSVAVYAKAPYLDGSLPESQYDDREIPHLTTNQLASVVCDFLDDVLEEQGIYEDLSILGSLDLRSLDTAYRDIYSLIGTATGIGAGLVGDLKNLKRAPLKDKRRTNSPAATADLEMLKALLNFLGEPDNANIIKKLIQGNLNMGIIKNYFTLDLDVNYMIKEALFKEAYKDTPVPKPISNTIDQMVEDLIAGFLVGTEEEPGFAPGLAPYINIATSNKPVYDFIEDLLQNAYNEVVVPLLNNELKEVIRELCGVVEDDESNLNDFANIFNIDYVVPTHTFPAGPSFVSELNNIAYEVVSAMIKGFNSWQPGGPEKVLANATAVAKFVMKNAGEAIFVDYVYLPAKSDAEIDAMTSQQIFAYILRLTLNQLVEYMYIPEDADSLTKILWYSVKELNDHNIPGVDYTNVPKTADGALDMLGDYIVYELNKKIDMNSTKGSKPGQGLLPYGLGFDGTLLAIVNYAMDNYGGLLSLTLSKTNVWAALNTLVFAVINSNWLPASVGGDLHELIINRVVKDALALNVENIFALLDRNPTSEFATSTIRQIIVKTVAKMLNLVFPGALNESYASLEVAFSNNELGNIVDRLLKQLKSRPGKTIFYLRLFRFCQTLPDLPYPKNLRPHLWVFRLKSVQTPHSKLKMNLKALIPLTETKTVITHRTPFIKSG